MRVDGTVRAIRNRRTGAVIGYTALLPRALSVCPTGVKNPTAYQQTLPGRFETEESARDALDRACREIRREGLSRRHLSLPPDYRAKSSGRLGTPDRNHTCEACGGLGEVSIYPCKRCGGSGELSSAMARQVVLSGPSGGAAAGLSDAALRKRLAADRSLGRIGRKR